LCTVFRIKEKTNAIIYVRNGFSEFHSAIEGEVFTDFAEKGESDAATRAPMYVQRTDDYL